MNIQVTRTPRRASTSPNMTRGAALALIALAVACRPATRDALDSAAGMVASDVRAEFAVLDIDIGRRADAESEVDKEVETFAPSDTIYASVKTTGTVRPGAITSRWTFPDRSAIVQDAQPVSRDRDATLLFFLSKSDGLMRGEYTFSVLVDGREVRTQRVTVR